MEEEMYLGVEQAPLREAPAKVRTILTSQLARDKTRDSIKKFDEIKQRLSNKQKNIYGR